MIAYNTELLRDICFNSSIAIEHFSEETAISMQARHSDILAASNVFELPVGQISVDGNICSIKVSESLSILLAPNYAALDVDSIFDWATVGRVKLMGINNVK